MLVQAIKGEVMCRSNSRRLGKAVEAMSGERYEATSRSSDEAAPSPDKKPYVSQGSGPQRGVLLMMMRLEKGRVSVFPDRNAREL